MASDDWRPKTLLKRLTVRAGYTDDRLFLRFGWAQPDPGGWLHDMLVYRDGRWRRYADPSPWVAGGEHLEHRGFYEDRISFLLDDGSVDGAEQFGGWLTVHDGMRSLPDAVDEATVTAHPHLGEGGLARTDIRKYLPHACEGEWWENDWRRIRSSEELAQLKADGVFLDLPMWRAHRSDPLGYGTDHHVLDYRHVDEGRHTYTAQAWDPVDGPTCMFDPAVVEDGALDHGTIADGDLPRQGVDTYALTPSVTTAFDPAVAEWEGAMIPRRPLQKPHGSAADWLADGSWADGRWTVEMSRALRTDHPGDTTQLHPGEWYTWSPAIHHGAGQRWHWVAYPYRLGIGVDPPPLAPGHASGPTTLTAVPFDGDAPDWDAVEPVELPLIFPGLLTWDDLTDASHPRVDEIRRAEVSMWQLYEKDPASFLDVP